MGTVVSPALTVPQAREQFTPDGPLWHFQPACVCGCYAAQHGEKPPHKCMVCRVREPENRCGGYRFWRVGEGELASRVPWGPFGSGCAGLSCVPRYEVPDNAGYCPAVRVAFDSGEERRPQSPVEPEGVAGVAFGRHIISSRRDTSGSYTPRRAWLRWRDTQGRVEA